MDATINRFHHSPRALRRAESFLHDHVPIAGRVVSARPAREDRPVYPPRATHEALVNAICHRAYVAGGGAIALAMDDDHLEIANPGALRFGLTPERLFLPHKSRPWNPIIAGVVYRAGIIERRGTGTLNMLKWCRENGSPPPAYTEQPGAVVVTFRPADAGAIEPADNQRQPESRPRTEADRVLRLLATEPLSKAEPSTRLGQRAVSGPLNAAIRDLSRQDLLADTLPDKPQSRLQRYRLTEAGRARRTAPLPSLRPDDSPDRRPPTEAPRSPVGPTAAAPARDRSARASTRHNRAREATTASNPLTP